LAYTRYIDKTQVFYLFDNDHITHRVLHVQFVSKVARTIARCLRLNEDLVEAISLGHDIGHAPFGHEGESILNQICQEKGVGAFAHNAQSVRWLMELENRGKGVNLCLQTIDGILAHNGELLKQELKPQRGKTWDDINHEYQKCLMDASYSKKLRPMTLEGCVMRISDVIAYIGRDIEDAVTLHLLERDELPEKVINVLGNSNSTIMNSLVLDLIENSYEKDAIVFSDKVFDALQELKDFNYKRIYLNPEVRVREGKLRRLFESIFADCLEDLNSRNEESGIMRFFNKRILMDEERFENTPPARAVIDFISGMTDDFFLTQARRILLPRGFGLDARH